MFFLLLFLFIAPTKCAQVSQQPEQIHLSLGAIASEMIITWVTFDPIDVPKVKYGINKLDKVAQGTSSLFTDGGSEQRKIYTHRVNLKNLHFNTTYLYHVGSSYGWSAVYWFKTFPKSTNWSPRFAVYGDMGNYNARALPKLQEESQNGLFDLILHVGDMAYDMADDNARVGDNFMRQIETIAAFVPYMACPGNHEQHYNFSNYVNRFSMINHDSGEMNNHFFSFNVGPAHIISFSTEFYYFTEYGIAQLFNQYNWIKQDLEKYNKPEMRAKYPWIITLGHRPMYCNGGDNDDCRNRANRVRKGVEKFAAPGLEELFYKNGVDLEFWAHEHMYERLWPIYDYKVYNGSTSNPYTNPKSPVHITTGSAGCQEELEPFVDDPADWSAKRVSDYGFTRMTIHNSTHLHLEQVSVEKDSVQDEIWIVKDYHGSYAEFTDNNI